MDEMQVDLSIPFILQNLDRADERQRQVFCAYLEGLLEDGFISGNNDSRTRLSESERRWVQFLLRTLRFGGANGRS